MRSLLKNDGLNKEKWKVSGLKEMWKEIFMKGCI
jgi:hypothetical protein